MRIVASLFVLLLAIQTQGQSPDAKKVELFKLSNEDLLKQAQTVHDKAMREYQSQLRAPATAEALLEKARARTTAIVVPRDYQPIVLVSHTPAVSTPKAASDAAKARLDSLRQKRDSLEREKQLLDLLSGGLDGGRAAAANFLNVLDDLNSFAFEMDLRVKDQSLKADAIPAALRAEAFEKLRSRLAEDAEQARKKGEEVRAGVERTAKALEEARKDVVDAEAAANLAAAVLAQEEKRDDLEKALKAKGREELTLELASARSIDASLRAERELSLKRFEARKAEAEAIRRNLDRSKPPADASTRVASPDDVEQAADAIRARIDYFGKRVELLRKYQATLTSLIDLGNSFEGETAVLSDHVFTTQIIRRILKPGETVDETLNPAKLAAEATKARAARKTAQAEYPTLEKQIAAAEKYGAESTRRLGLLTRNLEVEERMEAWEPRLKGLAAAQEVELFNKTAKALEAALLALQPERAAYESAKAAVAESTARREALKDPFVRDAEEALMPEKQKIQDDLLKFGGLERAKQEGYLTVSVTPPTPVAGNAPATPPAAPKAKPTPVDSLKVFQQTLSARMRVMDDHDAAKEKELKMMDALEARIIGFTKSLDEARLLSRQQNELALDMKRRVASGKLTAEALPDKTARALKRTIINILDSEAVAVMNAHGQLLKDRDALGGEMKGRAASIKLMKEILDLTGQRLDTHRDLARLRDELKRERKDLPDADMKRIEQVAANRLASRRDTMDILLGIDASSNSENLAELLRACHVELVEYEERTENLAKQREKVERLLELSRKESLLFAKFTPAVAGYLTKLDGDREDLQAATRAALRPESAEDILNAHEAKTGRELPRQAAIPEKDRTEHARKAASAIFDKRVRLEAGKEWLAVLESRQNAGLKAEAAEYQDLLGGIAADTGDVERRVNFLQGDATASATGEIDRVRRELFESRRRNVLVIAGKIGSILAGMFLLPPIANAFLRRLLGVNRRNTHGGLVLSFLKTFTRVGVYILAGVSVLNILGFDITAILAGLGIGGLAIGLASQHMIANVLSGIVIFVERPFSIGDRIKVAGFNAEVVGLTWRTTVLQNPEGGLINVPNSSITGATIENMTRKWVD